MYLCYCKILASCLYWSLIFTSFHLSSIESMFLNLYFYDIDKKIPDNVFLKKNDFWTLEQSYDRWDLFGTRLQLKKNNRYSMLFQHLFNSRKGNKNSCHF